MSTLSRSLALIAAFAAAAPPAPVLAAPAESAPTGVRVQQARDGGAGRALTLGLGKAVVIDLPAAARDVLLSDPEIAEGMMRTARRAYLIGRKVGQTNVFFFDAAGKQIAAIDLTVEPDTAVLADLLQAAAPDARVSLRSVNGAIVLTGTVSSLAESDRVQRLAERFAAREGQSSTESRVINLLAISGEEQVLVKVRVVEMSRTLVKQLGVNLNAENILNKFLPEDTFVEVATQNGYSIAGQLLGGVSGAVGVADNIVQPQTVTYGGLGLLQGSGDQTFSTPGSQSLGTAGVGGYNYTPPTAAQPYESYTFGPGEVVTKSKVDASIEAFERAGLLRVLAEPNLTAISGEAAKFLAGGEFPIPVGQDNGRISIEFKPFGVGLAVTPVVLSAGRISLKLATEVSELTNEGSIVAESIVIPALQVRRAETTVEIPSGGALMMAGLIQERTRQALEGLPGAKDLPVFGSLFRSRDFLSNETELVIIVTPYLVKATSPDKIKTPADGFVAANDFDAIFRGRFNQAYRTPASDASESGGLKGPGGFVVPDPSDAAPPPPPEPEKQARRVMKKGSHRP